MPTVDFLVPAVDPQYHYFIPWIRTWWTRTFPGGSTMELIRNIISSDARVCIIMREKGAGQATLIGVFGRPTTPIC
ncbi:hypothetical protein Y032_0507g2697 [Ancylostoma ceylanicum]|uniref:Uncharacterized protein n=1 Tax=Ancylostoma ceylanicum TaxID=53326 RepID=A0A016WTU4_9BILA|nr:hypothetical protein Y032_0507g2697 [Ancylostoma ceylanicum]